MTDPSIITGHLIGTVDKRDLLGVLKQWREGAKSKEEAEVLADLRDYVLSGELDG